MNKNPKGTEMEKTTEALSKYTAILRPTPENGKDGAYEALFKELGRSVVGYGSSPARALKNLVENAADVLEFLNESGKGWPEPLPSQEWEDYSGKITVRMPRSLHYKLHVLAEEEAVSLNTLVVGILAWGAEHKHCLLRPFVPMVSLNQKLGSGSVLMSERFSPPLDPGIANAVEALRAAGVETFESCQGGDGHAYPEPTVRFHGDRPEGQRALSVALQAGLNVTSLRRTWPILDGEPTGPYWEMTFVSVSGC